MLIDCTRCGEQFDTDRDHAAGRHADTWRCPKCGASHEPEEQLEASSESEAVADGGALSIEAGEENVEVHVHIHRNGGNND